MNKLERVARGTVIGALGGGAGWISLSHVYKFVMQHSAPGTHWTTGVIVAGVSELMPIGVALHARATGKLGPFAVFLLLLAGGFSLWAQIATADPSATGRAVAAFPTVAFMGLVKLMLAKDTPAAQVDPPPVQVKPPTEGPEPMASAEGGGTGAQEPAPPAKPKELKRRAARRSGKASSRAATAERVRAARLELGEQATQAQVGERAGCSAATVSRIENPRVGKGGPPTLRIVQAEAVGQS